MRPEHPYAMVLPAFLEAIAITLEPVGAATKTELKREASLGGGAMQST
jgi:hypothetical protein